MELPLTLVCPADKTDWTNQLNTAREVELCKSIASRLGLAININEDQKKLYLGRSKTPTPPKDAVVTYPSGIAYVKPNAGATEAARYGTTGVYQAAPLIMPSREDKLSDNFTAGEFMCHDTNYQYLRVAPKLVEALERIRKIVGRPIHINSAYRPPAYNASIGGVSNSCHIDGIAADISVGRMPIKDLYRACLDVIGESGGVGYYPNSQFIHIDVRGHAARWEG
jgi:hypothetical protein